MPGIPLVARETMYGQSRNGDQPCRQDSLVHLSAEEEIAAEESLSAYCKPVELYNILQRRAIRNPLYLQRCLHYKVRARHHKRIQMTVSLSGTSDDGLQIQNLRPMYIILAKLLSDIPNLEHSAVYRYTKARLLTTPSTEEGGSVAQANFILPEMNKLVREAKSGSLFILFVSYAEAYTSYGSETSREPLDNVSLSSSVEMSCLWGKISMESLFLSWEKFPNLNRGERVEMLSTIDLQPCLLKSGFLGQEKCLSFQMPESSAHMHVQVLISAEERGAKEKSPYSPYTYNNNPDTSSHVLGLRTGNVIFNYRYYHNQLQRTEVTEDFSCPFCLVKCASFKGLKFHLVASHDLFNFEFWVTEEYQAVNVSVKTDLRRSEIVADGVDPKQLIFFLCFKKLKRRKTKFLLDKAKHVQPMTLTSDLAAGESDLLNKAEDAYSSRIERARSSSVNDSRNAIPDPDCIQSISGGSLAPPAMLQFAKTRKLSIERSDFRNRALMEKRQFFHSHRAQPMLLEQVLSDHDSEDEVDDDVADLEDRRMLDDFVDVSKDEKQIMHLWNSFVRKQRILADGHIPWACEAFSQLHGHNLVQAPALIWCWRLFMIKLWNHGLLDARSMNNCSLILERCQKQETTPM
ncbi:polycomb group protein EMBRYONIC FLOWER 2 isoform X3 [Beta vulgaris subsp. vulgaris]|uniref:polycomb group protein EMBRYONIC FLOWER 2 isoform X3 n=1 Tax=Beta vulgaris subsp. vulgaris TaxID=3555 RepID=UPI0009005CC9|nr:polycomb group protein EMBRYONIC FLOWER 2 isoform X3 [Beta vulgaris subsp. vulgaris]